MDHNGTRQDASVTVRQIGATFGAEVSGMPIHGDVSPELLTQFVSYLHRYRVLVVPQACVEPADLVGFQPPLRAAGNSQPLRQHAAGAPGNLLRWQCRAGRR